MVQFKFLALNCGTSEQLMNGLGLKLALQTSVVERANAIIGYPSDRGYQ